MDNSTMQNNKLLEDLNNFIKTRNENVLKSFDGPIENLFKTIKRDEFIKYIANIYSLGITIEKIDVDIMLGTVKESKNLLEEIKEAICDINPKAPENSKTWNKESIQTGLIPIEVRIEHQPYWKCFLIKPSIFLIDKKLLKNSEILASIGTIKYYNPDFVRTEFYVLE